MSKLNKLSLTLLVVALVVSISVGYITNAYLLSEPRPFSKEVMYYINYAVMATVGYRLGWKHSK